MLTNDVLKAWGIEPDLVPRSRATNAYELLDEVVRVIEAEPRRLNMGNWIFMPSYVERELIPACGTVGCVAGWIVLLWDGPRAAFADRQNVPTRALQLMGSDGFPYSSLGGDLNRLFDGAVVRNADADLEEVEVAEPGDEDYVKLVVQRIREFQDEHEEFLKHRTLTPDMSLDPA
jgi:hypothetical protein